jgi:hypothetical protein
MDTELGTRGTPERNLPPTGTQSGKQGAASAPVGGTQLGERTAGHASGTQLGERVSGAVVTRLGPGVSAGQVPAWTAPSGTRPPRRRWRRMLRLLVLAAVLVAGLVWWLDRSGDDLAVAGVKVAPADEPGYACGLTVDVVGTIATNGEAGTVRYQWLRSDGETSAVLEQAVADGERQAEVHLMWTFTGAGRYPATATLKILDPTPTKAVGGFTYHCR